MLATIMAFSYLLIDGLRRLDLKLEAAEAEDLYYTWRIFALLMGIHPDGRPHDDSLIPATISEAAEFYASYVRRNNTMPDRNGYGVVLALDNLKMMEALLPRSLRLLGLGYAPRICMTELMTPAELARVGLTPLPGHTLLKAVLTGIFWLTTRRHEPFVTKLARLVLQGMVDVDRSGQVEFSIPFTTLDARGSAFE